MAEKYLSDNPPQTIDRLINSLDADKILVITDTNVKAKVFPLLEESQVIRESPILELNPGESGKNLDSVVRIWHQLENIGATRRSVILNIGGGVVTDLGGFASATFKRGIRYINFPTTVLGAVDAAVGGKTGINFMGLKNEIGAFHNPSNIILSSLPFSTLPENEFLSGYAEMVKIALVSDRKFYIDLLDFNNFIEDRINLERYLEKCLNIKEDIVMQDPKENGLRKILNFGHTAGHAFETLKLEKKEDITHGKAVAHGMLVALILSHMKVNFDSMEVSFYSDFMTQYYGRALIRCNEVDNIKELVGHDKKNPKQGEPAFSLLKSIGNPEINCMVRDKELTEALEIYIDMVG